MKIINKIVQQFIIKLQLMLVGSLMFKQTCVQGLVIFKTYFEPPNAILSIFLI